ncbi:MAG TPA: hypothetical protein DIV52_02670 [Ruminococcaceae bacterium]|jgi:hypothetical protein|nr:hypothetical protein [Oscillospiraceae bacterium]
MTKVHVKLTFTDDLLGTSSGNPELHREFIASKAPDAAKMEEEVASLGVEAVEEKSMTVFPKMADGTPYLWDYQIRGFFKEICGAMRGIPGTKSSKVKAYKKKVDNTIFVEPREIPLDLHGMKIADCQRPLRASTMQGERIALANSEVCPQGTTCEFDVLCMVDEDVDMLREWLEYGKYKGIGQWRNSGKGRFEFTFQVL